MTDDASVNVPHTPDTPRFDALSHGLWRRVLAGDGMINTAMWNRARAERGFVGTCRECGGHLAPEPVTTVGQVEWYTAACISCGHEVAAPGARILRGSSRFSEMPPGWWEQRRREGAG